MHDVRPEVLATDSAETVMSSPGESGGHVAAYFERPEDPPICPHTEILLQFPVFNDEGNRKMYEEVQQSNDTGYDSTRVPQWYLQKKSEQVAFKLDQMARLGVDQTLPGREIFEVGTAEGSLLAVWGRPARKPHEWVCIAQATGHPKPVAEARPTLFQPVDSDELRKRWDAELKKHFANTRKEASRKRMFGPLYRPVRKVAAIARRVVYRPR